MPVALLCCIWLKCGLRDGLCKFVFIMQVNGVKGKAQTCRKSLNDSLEGDIRDFLINESELHTYDDLTKVNPVTPTTGKLFLEQICFD